MRTPEQSERRASNINNLDGRLAGKYLENGDPRGGGWRRKVVLSFTLYEVNPISIEEVYSNLGIGDGPRTPFHELHPAVTPRDCTKSIELDSRTGRPIRTVIFDPNGVILEEKKY